jgi:hypothetical protein
MLYTYSKYALTMKITKGFDYIIDEKNKIDVDIFQPHFKYEGQSWLSKIIKDFGIP